MQLFDLRNQNAMFNSYQGKIQAPRAPSGVDSFLDSIAIFSLAPLSVKVSNSTSAELYFEWVKPQNAT